MDLTTPQATDATTPGTDPFAPQTPMESTPRDARRLSQPDSLLPLTPSGTGESMHVISLQPMIGIGFT